MKCDCYEKAYAPVIRLLERADGIMYFAMPNDDDYRQKLHDIIVGMNTTFRCIDECWKKNKEE